MDILKEQNVLVTGGTGMIGRQLVQLLIDRRAEVTIASLDDPSRAHPKAKFTRLDLTDFKNCQEVCEGRDYIFNLVGIKGSPKVTATQPASFFVPTVMCNTNMAEAARRANPKWYLYTSSVGVYSPADVFREDDVWKTFPSENDKFAGWGKRMGELQLEAYSIEYNWKNVSIIRPANVYGPYDNFDPINAMVIPSLIKRAVDGENPFTVWGDGSPIRDFVHAKDVAAAMLFAVEHKINQPVNVGSGSGISIKHLVEVIVSNLEPRPDIIWDTSKPAGDKIRVMDMSRLSGYGFKTEVSLEDGIREVMDWYKENKDKLQHGYNVFTAKS